MADVEKVIKGLKYLHDVKKWSVAESEQDAKIRRNITTEALALLKAREPEKPTNPDDMEIYCGYCGETVGYDVLGPSGLDATRFNYCPHCGRAVKWDD